MCKHYSSHFLVQRHLIFNFTLYISHQGLLVNLCSTILLKQGYTLTRKYNNLEHLIIIQIIILVH